MFIDPNPTSPHNSVLTLEEVRAPAPAPAPPPQEERSALPSITDVEQSALRGVDLAEQVADPLNRFNLARVGIVSLAWCARKLRKR